MNQYGEQLASDELSEHDVFFLNILKSDFLPIYGD